MKFLSLIILSTFILSAEAKVLKSDDAKNACTLYRVTETEKDSEIKKGETVYSDRVAFGFTIKNMVIDFKNEEVRVMPMVNYLLGLDRILVSEARIDSSNKKFTSMVNKLNKKTTAFKSLCLSSDNTIVYGKEVE